MEYYPRVPYPLIAKPRRQPVAYDRMAIYAWIVEYKRTNDGNSPSLDEIMDAFNVSSKSVASYLLKRLENAGLIRLPLGKKQSRSIVVEGGQWTMAKRARGAG